MSTAILKVISQRPLSVLYFLWNRDLQYTFITLFVLIVLTISLLAH